MNVEHGPRAEVPGIDKISQVRQMGWRALHQDLACYLLRCVKDKAGHVKEDT